MRELANFIERAVILTRGRSLEAPLSELRRACLDQATQTPALQDRDDIARIVKETLNALDGKKSVDDEQTRNQREGSSEPLRNARDVLVVTMERLHAWASIARPCFLA